MAGRTSASSGFSQYGQLCGGTDLQHHERLKANEKFEYDVFWKQYDKLLRQENLITFDIMCGEVSKLFIDDDSLTHKYKEQYKYVFQDEAQDSAQSTNPSSRCRPS